MIKIPNVLKVYGLICYICLLELRDLFFLIIKVYIEMTWHNRFSKNKVKKIMNNAVYMLRTILEYAFQVSVYR